MMKVKQVKDQDEQKNKFVDDKLLVVSVEARQSRLTNHCGQANFEYRHRVGVVQIKRQSNLDILYECFSSMRILELDSATCYSAKLESVGFYSTKIVELTHVSGATSASYKMQTRMKRPRAPIQT